MKTMLGRTPAQVGSAAAGIALAVAALVNPAVASAHSFVVNTAPHRDAATTAPTEVTTTWNEAVTNVKESVVGPDKATWSTGPVSGSGAVYSVALRPAPLPGAYTVNWEVTSDDGDDIHGSWGFTVNPS